MIHLILFTGYKYVALALLAIAEGPVLSLISGFLIRLGYLSFLPVILILVGGDIVSDTIYYFLAVKSNGEKYIKKYGGKYKSISENIEMLNHLWSYHGRLTMFLGKFAYGFTAPLVVSSAISGLSYRKLMEYILPPTIVKYTAFVAIGYYMANEYAEAERYIYLSAIYVPLIILMFFIGYKLIIKYLRGKAGGREK